MSEHFQSSLYGKLPPLSASAVRWMDSSSLERLGQRLIDLAWAAGLIDGEGCIMIRGSVAVDVQSTSRHLIQRLHDILGGRCSVESRRTRQNRAVFRWRIYGQEAVAALDHLLPFLVEKKKQAQLACCYYSYLPGSAMRESIKKRIKQLKKTS